MWLHKAFKPLEASFSPQRSLASPFRAFLPRCDRRRVSSPHPLLRFSAKPRGLTSALQRLSPTPRAVSLSATGSISPGRDRLLSWDFSPLGLLSPPTLSPRHLPLETPLSFLVSEGLSTRFNRNLRVSLSEALASPHAWGAGPSGVSHPLSHATCSKSKLSTDYFFISMSGDPLRSPR